MDKQVIDKYVDLSNIKLVEHGNNKDKFNWENSIGCLIPFKFKDIKGVFEIVDYNKGTNDVLVLKYQNNILPKINISSLKSCKLSNTLKDYLFKWKYNIGDKLQTKNQDITIIDRKYFCKNKNVQKYYKIHCNKCSFNSIDYYKNGILIKDYWITEYSLILGYGCPCCCSGSKIVVEGINDIPTTAPWMIPYFQGGYNEAKLYTCQSSKELYFKCPDCGRIKTKNMPLRTLYKTHSISCLCSDKISYPNKFSYNVFKQLNSQLKSYIREYCPKWITPYRYDHYFELQNGDKYIVEMDGLIGHGKQKWKSKDIDKDGLLRDKIKDKLAKEHNIKVIRINADKSDMIFLKNNIINKLNNILDFSHVNWKEAELFSLKNIIKDVCNYYNTISQSFDNIYKEFGISSNTINKYLKRGRILNWCNYKTIHEIRKENIIIASSFKKDNPKLTSDDISKSMNITKQVIKEYLQIGNELGLCNYNEKEDTEILRKKGMKHAIEASNKMVYVYDLEGNYINTYKSVNELERQSLKDFGIQLNAKNISKVCLGQRKTHKGFTYSYVEKIA